MINVIVTVIVRGSHSIEFLWASLGFVYRHISLDFIFHMQTHQNLTPTIPVKLIAGIQNFISPRALVV